MGKSSATFVVEDLDAFKRKALAWADRADICCYLDHNSYPGQLYHGYELIVAAGAEKYIRCEVGNAFEKLKQEWAREWLFGYFSYDLKNEVEKLSSNNHDGLEFPELYFFKPKDLLLLKENTVEIICASGSPENIWQEIQQYIFPEEKIYAPVHIRNRISREKYIRTVSAIRDHIEEGDVYELNFCQEFYAEQTEIDPLHIFHRLNSSARAPFSAYLKMEEKYLLCASPERFLKKEERKLISQPIKGTIRRGVTAAEDELLKTQLQNDIKERAENVMIVDLMRNDLTRSAKCGSIKVEELFEIYTFETVHQMISTVTAELREEVHFIDAIKAAFPMGSMTGAPKVMAMELIEHYEETKRGLFSGAVGYISPDGDFDLNVVIRSILYNAGKKYLSFQTGGAITYDSVPEKEYEESLLKAENLKRVLL